MNQLIFATSSDLLGTVFLYMIIEYYDTTVTKYIMRRGREGSETRWKVAAGIVQSHEVSRKRSMKTLSVDYHSENINIYYNTGIERNRRRKAQRPRGQ